METERRHGRNTAEETSEKRGANRGGEEGEGGTVRALEMK